FEPDLDSAARRTRVLETMDAVGLLPEMLNRFPHEFSGGQAQRIGIARAIVSRPKLIVCDEPVSALDVSIQAQIIRLLDDLKQRYNLTLIFISHDLSVVRLISDRLLVLYLGRVAESGSVSTVFDAPRHPYTQALLSAAPTLDPAQARSRQRILLKGEPPSPINPPSGCVFRTRCPIAAPECAETRPALSAISADHEVACLKAEAEHAPFDHADAST
ncbi:MAG: ATP-binding cassette domain-containing protein, partial [Rhodobacteraceae bacterium]|nr:ATP-binding cassette domain-containing protein [Paracoccaceae bacterium]